MRARLVTSAFTRALSDSQLLIVILLATPGACLATLANPVSAPTPREHVRLAQSRALVAPETGPSAAPTLRFLRRTPSFIPHPITAEPTPAPTPGTAEAPKILGVRVNPTTVVAGTTTTVTFQAGILDRLNQVKRVRLQRLSTTGATDVGTFDRTSLARGVLYQLSLPVMEANPGRIDFQVVADYQPSARLYSFSSRLPQTRAAPVSIEVRPAPAPPTFIATPVATPTDASTRRERSDLGLRIKVPAGWQIDESLQALRGPMNLNTFNSQYVRPGGMIPVNQALIDITRIKLPRFIEEFISGELEESQIHSRDDNFQVAGFNGRRITYTDSFSPGLAYHNVVVYLPHGDYLYKFFLTYNEGDPESPRFSKNFREVLDSVEFLP